MRTFATLCISALLLWVSCHQAIGQHIINPHAWYSGSIHLKNGGTLEGLLQYHPDKPFIMLKVSGSIKTYNVQQVASFEVLDFEQNVFRWFYALPIEEKGRRKEVFFELLSNGDHLALLSREGLVHRNVPVRLNGLQVVGWDTDFVPGETFYVLYKQHNRVVPFPDTRKDLLHLMATHKEAIDQYIRANGLELQNRQYVVKLFYYYLSLQQQTPDTKEDTFVKYLADE